MISPSVVIHTRDELRKMLIEVAKEVRSQALHIVVIAPVHGKEAVDLMPELDIDFVVDRLLIDHGIDEETG